jgi:hypothetical protein
MNKDDLKRIGDNPEFIPGIYNYCDRWCDRCPFTSRCMNYAMGAELQAEQSEAGADSDPTNAAFWQNISDSLQAAFDLIKEIAEEQHLDLDALSDGEVRQAMERREEHRQSAREDELARASEEYVEMVDDWFAGAEGAFLEKGGELERLDELEIAGVNVSAEVADLNDAVEVIRWYQYQIQVKLMRAISSRLNEDDSEFEWVETDEQWKAELEQREDIGDETEMEMEPDQKDSDGSAKVSLIGIDRSIAAWSRLLAAFPEQEDNLLAILVQLERLRRATERRFPDARAFRRPGFDDPSPPAPLPGGEGS